VNWLSGQDRRAWLDRQDERLGNALSYYLGPAAAPVNALATVGSWLSPGADMMDMADSSRDLMAADGGWSAAQAGLGLGAATLGMAIPGTAKGVSEGVEGGVRAFHGSPADFDRFDSKFIGTGEGAQAYGHGLYFAESEGVAKSYRDKLSGNPMVDDRRAALEAKRNVLNKRIERAAAAGADDTSIRQELQSVEDKLAVTGKMYEVRINADPADFLDWDRSLVDQPGVATRLGHSEADIAAAKAAQARYDDALARALEGGPADQRQLQAEMSEARAALKPFEASGIFNRGDELARGGNSVFQSANDPNRAKALREAGIPGIRYLDQGSRTAGDGSRNYVVFDDKLIEIMKKYGWMLPTAGVGLSFGSDE
jgi:hypothetical protein